LKDRLVSSQIKFGGSTSQRFGRESMGERFGISYESESKRELLDEEE
jgi:hypothetical protein